MKKVKNLKTYNCNYILVKITLAFLSLMEFVKPATSQTNLFNFVKKVTVTPDEHFNGSKIPGNILYNGVAGSLVVVLNTFEPDTPLLLDPLLEPAIPCLDSCPGGIIGCKEYNIDMQPTGNYEYLACGIGDMGDIIIDNYFYFAKVWNHGPGTADFWRLYKFDAYTWEKLGQVDIPLDSTQEWSDGPTFSFINGLITVSGEYFPDGTPDGPLGRGSHHHFVTTDLQLMGEKILVSPDVPPHCSEFSMHQLPNGDIIMFGATAYYGDLMVMRLDKDWNFIEKQTLRKDGFFPIGSVLYGGYWFVAYIDLSKKPAGPPWPEGDPPVRNVGLAAFDTSWNLIQDELITVFDTVPDTVGRTEGENPGLELLENKLYVSYTISNFEAKTMKLIDGQDYVNVYELTIPNIIEPVGQSNDFGFSMGYPNPFCSSVSFKVDLPECEKLTAIVFNQLGQKVVILSDNLQSSGTHILQWDGTDNSGRQLMNGIYYVQCQAGKFHVTRKVVMIR